MCYRQAFCAAHAEFIQDTGLVAAAAALLPRDLFKQQYRLEDVKLVGLNDAAVSDHFVCVG